MEYNRKPIENPFEALQTAVAFSCKDWGAEKRDAWVYGIVLGWDDNCFAEFQSKFGWGRETFDRLKRLHSKFETVNRHYLESEKE